MVLPLYLKLIVKFQELVEIIDIKYNWRIKRGGGARGPCPPLKMGKVVVNLGSQTNNV